MLGKKSRWIAPLAATAAVLLAASSAGAADPEPDTTIPAVDSCGDFDLGLSSTDGKFNVVEFENGNFYSVGTGVILTWSNEGLGEKEGNGKTYTVKTSGSVSKYTENPDGTWTLTATGHNGFVYFESDDVEPGAYQYTGRVVVQIESLATFKVTSVDVTGGKAVDICALLR